VSHLLTPLFGLAVPAGAIFVAQAAQRDLTNPDKAAYAEFGEPNIEPRGTNKSDLIQDAHRIIQTMLPLLAKVLRILEQIIRILENAVRLENDLAREGAGTSLESEVTEESASKGEIGLSSLSGDEAKIVKAKKEFTLEGAGDTSKVTKDSPPLEGAISTFPLNGNDAQASGIANSPGGADGSPKSEMTVEVVPIKGVMSIFSS
jgi:hypothetical protein